jgi:hypothetical protein
MSHPRAVRLVLDAVTTDAEGGAFAAEVSSETVEGYVWR